MPRIKSIDPEKEATLLSYIRAGAFPHVAAEAVGIPKEEFVQMLDRSRNSKRKNVQQLYKNVISARAIARLMAEKQVHDDDPKAWLRSGPGRETQDAEGWTSTVRPSASIARQAMDLFSNEAFLSFMTTLRMALAPHPEAMLALSSALESAQETDKVRPVRVRGLKVVEEVIDLDEPLQTLEAAPEENAL